MNLNMKSTVKSLGVKRCVVCEQVKPVYVVVTHHGKKDIDLPCCSSECMEVIAEVLVEVNQQRI